MRARHRRSADGVVAAALPRREDAHARRGDLDRRVAEVAERREAVARVDRRDRVDVGAVRARRRVVGGVVGLVARREREADALRRGDNGRVERVRDGAAEAHVGDRAPGRARADVVDARDDVRVGAAALRVEHLHGDDLRAGGDPDDADPVAHRRDRAGDVRAVPVAVVGVLRVAAGRDERPAEARVDAQVRVVEVHARVDDARPEAGAAHAAVDAHDARRRRLGAAAAAARARLGQRERLVGLDVGDVRVSGERLRRLRRELRGEAADRVLVHVRGGHALPLREPLRERAGRTRAVLEHDDVRARRAGVGGGSRRGVGGGVAAGKGECPGEDSQERTRTSHGKQRVGRKRPAGAGWECANDTEKNVCACYGD